MWIPILLICSLPVSGALWAEQSVRGAVGGAITIDCHYEAKYRSHTKYWCRGWSRQCSVLVETNGERGQSEQMSITDNPQRRIFTVTMENLHSEDTGWYSCGITTPGHDPMFIVHLQVSDDALWAAKNISGDVGKAITIDCHYEAKYRSHTKYWYRGWSRQCSVLVETDGQHGQSEQVSITDNPEQRIFTVTMENLHSEDTGWYSCGITTSGYDPMFNVHLQVSDDALWAAKNVSGDVGKAITIDCHYEAKYRSHTKYWCRGWSRQCSVLVETNGQHGQSERVLITDNPQRRIFTVTMVDLLSKDTGWYSCAITTSGYDPMVNVHLQVSDEPVSVPLLQVLSSPTASCVGGSVSVVCESVQGSFPIQYAWYEKTSSMDSKISGTSELDLRCQSFTHRHHQYYCTASNSHGEKSSEMINVVIFSSTGHCSYQLQFNHTSAMSAKKCVKGVVGRAVTIDCHYEAKYRSRTKYWCHGWTRQCSVLVETNGRHGQRGRMSITDNPKRGIFTVTMQNLRSRDTGWYSCGISTPGVDPRFKVHLQVSDESRYISETSVRPPKWTSPSKTSVTKSLRTSRSETSVTKSTRSSPSKTFVTDSMKSSPSETSETRFNNTRRKNIHSISAKSYLIWKVGRWLFLALLGIWTIAVTWFMRDKKRSDQLNPHQVVHEKKLRIPD